MPDPVNKVDWAYAEALECMSTYENASVVDPDSERNNLAAGQVYATIALIEEQLSASAPPCEGLRAFRGMWTGPHPTAKDQDRNPRPQHATAP